MKRFKYILTIASISFISCINTPGDFGSVNREQSGADDGNIKGEDKDKRPLATTVDGRPAEEVLCQEGPRIIELVKKGDFSEQFKLICENGSTNQTFADIIDTAYEGTGEATIHILKNSTSGLYVTNLAFAYALKIPLEDPSQFADYKVHNIFATGITTDTSNLVIDVESREEFPGRRSIESIVLNYDLKTADGAAIYDKRITEFNTYLLVEDNRDVVVSTELLVDVETNPNYHLANGLTIGVTGGNGYTYIIFVTDLLVKDRIDPARMERALTDLNRKIPSQIYEHILSTGI